MSALAKTLVSVIEANDSERDEEAAELVLRPLLVEVARVLGPHRVRVALDELRDVDWTAIAPAVPPTEQPWCYRVAACGRLAVVRVFDQKTGEYRPACPRHAEGFGPLETQELA